MERTELTDEQMWPDERYVCKCGKVNYGFAYWCTKCGAWAPEQIGNEDKQLQEQAANKEKKYAFIR